jgi:Immunoglobulin domain
VKLLVTFKIGWTVLVCSFIALQIETAAANPAQLYATVQKSPPRITLNWPNPGGVTGYTVYRTTTIGGNIDGSGNWGSPIANLSGSATSFADTNVLLNVSYEYRVTAGGVTNGDGYINAGIEVPLEENRGKLILLVDNSFSSDLVFELNQLQKDLVGDGWTVLRHDVARNDKPANIKALVKSDYIANPTNVAAVFLLGHIPVAYSGWIDPDDHGPRPGPTDTFYGDMTGNWTDNINYGDNSITNHPWWINLPGDGKFDPTTIPGRMDLQVGRVDFYNMTAFAPYGLYEGDLLRRYLKKDHDFRSGLFTVVNRGAEMNSGQGSYCQNQFFGPNNTTSISDYFSTFTNNSYLWLTKGGGGGNYDSSADIGDTADFAASPAVKVVFNSWFASEYWEWDVENGFLRAPLAANGYGLVSFWSENPCYVLHHMALGKNIGYSARLSQNNVSFYAHHGYLDFNLYRRGIHMSLMGDPTLRMHVVTPPSNLVTGVSGGQVILNWTASPQAGLLGYNIYRAGSASGPFTRLNDSYVVGTTYTDTNPPAGSRIYMVRAVKVESSSGSGSYINASQGIVDEQGPKVLLTDDVTGTKVKVVFDKALDSASAQTAGNYSLNNGASVNSAALQADGHTVLLGTSIQADGLVYTLTINNVADQLNPHNVISNNTQVSYLYSEIAEYASDTNTSALWHLNGNGTDVSGNGNTLTYGSGVSFVESSPVGTGRLALRTTNTDSGGTIAAKANIADSLVMPSARPFTFEARVYVNAWAAYGVTGQGNILTLVQDYDANFYMIQQGMWDLPAYGKTIVNGVTLLDPSQFQAVAPTGKWFHMALVFDGTNKNYLYIDGRLVAGPITTAPNFGRTGAWTTTMGNFNGYIDEVRLSKVARTFLAPPTWLTANAASSSQINLAWTNNANNADGFEIQRWNPSSTSATIIATVATNVLSFSDTNLTGGTQYYYRIRNYQGTNKSDFSLSVSAITSLPSTLPPTITTQPQAQTVNAGSNATFAVLATGTAPLSYQWKFGGNDISGATNSAFTITNTQPINAGNYSVLITNIAGSMPGSNAALTVIIPPALTSQPQGANVAAGADVLFSVGASGTAPLAYQWRLNGLDIANATTSSYTRTNTQTADAGNYSVVVTNVAGNVTGSNAVLTVNNPPILAAISNRTVHVGSLITFVATATDTDLPTNILNFSLISGAPDNATINATNGNFSWGPTEAQLGTNQITVRVTDGGLPSLSDEKTFSINVVTKPLIQSIQVSEGTVTLTWSAIPGQTYHVEYKTNLMDNGWTPLPDNVVSQSGIVSKTNVTNFAVQCFYRIILVP